MKAYIDVTVWCPLCKRVLERFQVVEGGKMLLRCDCNSIIYEQPSVELKEATK